MLTNADLVKIKTIVKAEVDPLKIEVTQLSKHVGSLDKRFKRVETYNQRNSRFP